MGVILVTLFLSIGSFGGNGTLKLVSPGFIGFTKQPASPTPSPNMKAPKSFQFDANSDLNAELEKVDPLVLDSDFN